LIFISYFDSYGYAFTPFSPPMLLSFFHAIAMPSAISRHY